MDRDAGEDSGVGQADGGINKAAGASTLAQQTPRPGLSSGTAQATLIGAKEAARFPRTLSISIDGKAFDNNGAESWLAGKLLEHAVSTAHEALRSYRDLDATITVGDRTATVKVTT